MGDVMRKLVASLLYRSRVSCLIPSSDSLSVWGLACSLRVHVGFPSVPWFFLSPPKNMLEWSAYAELPLDVNKCVLRCDGPVSRPGAFKFHIQYSQEEFPECATILSEDEFMTFFIT